MKRWPVVLTVLAVLGGPAPARAGSDLPLGLPKPPDPGKVFEAITGHLFDLPAPKVDDVLRVLPNPDDAAVALFMANRAGRTPEDVVALRRGGLPWIDVSIRLGVRPDVFFVPVPDDRPVGPPFGKAYGHWRKHRHEPHARLALSDAELRDLVAVRMAHDYYGLTPEKAMELRRARGDVRRVMVGEYETRHGKGPEKDAKGEGHDERGHGKAKGHGGEKGKVHGHDRD